MEENTMVELSVQNLEKSFEVGDKLTVFGDYTMICRSFQAHERFSD